jgi:rubrerythrin
MKLPQQCPSCKVSLRDRTVKRQYRHLKKLFTRAIEVTEDTHEPTEEQTNVWRCPDCGHVWKRGQKT